MVLLHRIDAATSAIVVAQSRVARRAPVGRVSVCHGLAGEPWHVRLRRLGVSLGSADRPEEVVLLRNDEAPSRVVRAGAWPVLLHNEKPARIALRCTEVERLGVPREPRPPAAQLVEAGAPQPATVVCASGASPRTPTSSHRLKLRPGGAPCKAWSRNRPISAISGEHTGGRDGMRSLSLPTTEYLAIRPATGILALPLGAVTNKSRWKSAHTAGGRATRLRAFLCCAPQKASLAPGARNGRWPWTVSRRRAGRP